MFRPIRFAVLLAGATLAFSAFAQPAPDNAAAPADAAAGPAADPPTRVARLSFIRGDVSFVPAGENDWTEAQVNRPLITGDKLWTDRGSRAELEIGSSTIRMDQSTSFDFLNLDDNNAQVELTQGALNLRVRRLYDNQAYEIDTPTLAFVVNRVGEYRIDVLPNGQATIVTVLHGGGDTYGEGGARFRVEEGQSVTFNDPQLQNYQTAGVPPPDEFDRFYAERDQRWDNSGSRRFVSEEVIGYEDLDENGEWSDVPEYGNVWYPTTVAVGWAPYHSGHWGWVGAYGWTWVDEAPWGFAPFHYGRWAYVGNRWGWCPGPIAIRPVYAPALVAFVGGGVGVSIGFGSGPVGWFPLGPRDVYFPGYHVSERYFSNVNISNTRVVNNTTINNYYGNYSRGNVNYGQITYSNRNVAGAVTAVPASAFVSSRPVAASAIAVNQQTFANARVSPVAAVAPTHASLASPSAAKVTPPTAVTNRQIVAATKPPAPVASFAQRETILQKNPGQPLSTSQLHTPVTGGAPAGIAGNSNLKVVTAGGTAIHTAAPVLPAHAGVATPTNAAGVNARTSTVSKGVPAVQTTPATNGVAGKGQPLATQHLNSSQFAHPATNGVTTSGGQSSGRAPIGTTNAIHTTNQPITSHSPATSVTGATGSKSTPQVNTTPQVHNVTPTKVTPQTSKTTPISNTGGNAHSSSTGSTSNQAVHTTPQVYHAPVSNTNSQVQMHTPPPPPPVQHTPPPPPSPKDKKDDDKHKGGG